MPDFNSLIITAADYKVVLSIPVLSGKKRFPLLTLSDISWSIKVNGEIVYAIGNRQPIANPNNEESYEGKLSMQSGEFFSILAFCGLANSTEIQGATLGIAATGGAFTRTFGNVNILSEEFQTKAGDKQSKIDISFNALSIE